ncbi:hypothetical protein ACN47E_007127 [Coniothyrium glycines]
MTLQTYRLPSPSGTDIVEVPQHIVPQAVSQHGALALRRLEIVRIKYRLLGPVAVQQGIRAREAATATAALNMDGAVVPLHIVEQAATLSSAPALTPLRPVDPRS